MKLICIREDCDEYHQRRADKHGYIYVVQDNFGMDYSCYEARSIATGVVCTLDTRHCMEYTDALQEPEGLTSGGSEHTL